MSSLKGGWDTTDHRAADRRHHLTTLRHHSSRRHRRHQLTNACNKRKGKLSALKPSRCPRGTLRGLLAPTHEQERAPWRRPSAALPFAATDRATPAGTFRFTGEIRCARTGKSSVSGCLIKWPPRASSVQLPDGPRDGPSSRSSYAALGTEVTTACLRASSPA